MPQMAPLNWLLLFMFFTFVFFFYNTLNYFIFNYKINKKINKKNKLNYFWKW